MADSSCATFPTLTRTDEVVTTSLSTSFTTSVTTLPPTTSTITRPCVTLIGSETASCSPSTSITTIPGATSTVDVPVTLTFTVTSSQQTTLFGSSCTPINRPPDTTSNQPPPTTSNTSLTFLPIPTVITSESSSTQPNGSVVVQTVTATSTQNPFTVQTPGQQNRNRDTTNLAPIIGGAVGGFFGLIAIVLVIWFILKRRNRWNDVFDKDDMFNVAPHKPSQRFSLDVDTEPKPYQYGLVGHTGAPTPASPPHSPPLLPAVAVGNANLSTSASQHGQGHSRNRSSLTPLMPSPSPGQSVTTAHSGSSRPSTAGSTQPLRPISQGGGGGYPPPLPTSSSTSSQQQQRQPDFGRTTSAGSNSYAQSNASSFNNWAGSSASAHNGAVPFTPFGAAMGSSADEASHQATISPSSSYFVRSGSPTSIQDQRILQVANMSPSSDVFDLSPSSAAAAFAAPSGPSSSVSGSSSGAPLRDGKGRLVVSNQSSKPPLVHLDGGRLVEASSSSSAAAATAAAADAPPPPAYSA